MFRTERLLKRSKWFFAQLNANRLNGLTFGPENDRWHNKGWIK